MENSNALIMKWMIFGFLLVTTQGICQNLVSNGGFEEYYECINEYGDIGVAKGWFQLVGSSDYFNRCCKIKNFVGVPYNFNGYQEAFNGNAYAGLYLFSFDKRFPKNGFYKREYLHTILNQPLEKDRKYLVSFYYSLADSAEFFTDHFSICFSKEKELRVLDRWKKKVLVCKNRVSTKVSESKASDNLNWHRVDFEYLAKGAEEYLVIGFFHDDLTRKAFKKLVRKNKIDNVDTQDKSAYYYIDDVSVVMIN
jgi:OmpA-OmpF porin, OOP family